MSNIFEKNLMSIRPTVRLCEIERRLKKNKVVIPPPTRSTLVNMCEDGTFETAGNNPTSMGWLVYEDSYVKWKDSVSSGGTVLRLSEIEALIRTHKIITPPLSRGTLINLCKAKVLETTPESPTSLGWLVYETSFLEWVKSLNCVEARN